VENNVGLEFEGFYFGDADNSSRFCTSYDVVRIELLVSEASNTTLKVVKSLQVFCWDAVPAVVLVSECCI
jgi:hypothetical protein